MGLECGVRTNRGRRRRATKQRARAATDVGAAFSTCSFFPHQSIPNPTTAPSTRPSSSRPRSAPRSCPCRTRSTWGPRTRRCRRRRRRTRCCRRNEEEDVCLFGLCKSTADSPIYFFCLDRKKKGSKRVKFTSVFWATNQKRKIKNAPHFHTPDSNKQHTKHSRTKHPKKQQQRKIKKSNTTPFFFIQLTDS